jgi:hypothetical protein
VNVNLLIDNIVRQTTVLVAQLATAAGGRAPLAHVAGQVFHELVRELKSQGIGNKVIADMFGLTLRTYHDRVRRSGESATERGSSLWEAVLRYVREQDVVTRAALLRRFAKDDEASVRGVLTDLVESGLVFKMGRLDHTTYRAANPADTQAMVAAGAGDGVESLLWVWLHQRGSASLSEVCQELALTAERAERALAALVAQGRVACDADGSLYRADTCVIPYGDELGWEAALFDHFQAVVTAIGSKVTRGRARSRVGDSCGGSTYHFDLYRGHPAEERVLGLLETVRERASALRREVDEMQTPTETNSAYRVVFYAGQNVLGFDEGAVREGEEE